MLEAGGLKPPSRSEQRGWCLRVGGSLLRHRASSLELPAPRYFFRDISSRSHASHACALSSFSPSEKALSALSNAGLSFS